MKEAAPRTRRRPWTLVLVAAATVASAGYLTGTARIPARSGYHSAESPSAPRGLAPRQSEMASARSAERRAELVAAFELLGRAPRTPGDAIVVSAEERAAAVLARAERRAYDGAPPTVPHAVDQRGLPACLVCHERGMRVNDRVAPAMSHAAFASCLQCHAPSRGVPVERPRTVSVAENSGFVGLEAPGPGARAQPGAPPQIPHRTFMRERCESCHGTFASGLAVSHPNRQSCTQCHAPSATLDQRPRAEFGRLGFAGGVP